MVSSRLLLVLGAAIGGLGLLVLLLRGPIDKLHEEAVIQGQVSSVVTQNGWLPGHSWLSAFKLSDLQLEGQSDRFRVPSEALRGSEWLGRAVEIQVTEVHGDLRWVLGIQRLGDQEGENSPLIDVKAVLERDQINKMRLGAAAVIIAAILIVAAKLVGIFARIKAGDDG